MRSLACAASILLATMTASVSAGDQPIAWRVLLDRTNGEYPGLPSSPRDFKDAILAEEGNDQIGVRFQLPFTIAGHWAYRQGEWVQTAANDVSGSMLGPGRTGAEGGDVFLEFASRSMAIAGDGQRVFRARAGSSENPSNSSWGLWRWNAIRNVEIARASVDTGLGPNLGPGWSFFIDAMTWPAALIGKDGSVIIDSWASGPADVLARIIVRSSPGGVNQTCLLEGSSDPAFAPGIEPGDQFKYQWVYWSATLAADNRILVSAQTDTGRFGLWQVCDGAPRALMVSRETGARGPDIGVASAEFTSIPEGARSGKGDSIYFQAGYRRAQGEPSYPGLFWFDGSRHRPLVLGSDDEPFGPQIDGARWGDAPFSRPWGMGEYATFSADVVLADDAHTTHGLWRVRPGERPQPLALIGVEGAYAPGPGQTWVAFIDVDPLADGDVLIVANTDSDPVHALWRLSPGLQPQKILSVGDVVGVPMGPAIDPEAVVSFDRVSVGKDGTLMVVARLEYGQPAILSMKLQVDSLFTAGFDG